MSETLLPAEAQLRLNNLSLPCTEGLTLATLLSAQGVNPEMVATAVNDVFVPRAMRSSTSLRPGDTVLTFQAIVGG